MAAASFNAVAVVIPDPQYDNTPNDIIVNQSIGWEIDADSTIRTLSATNPSGLGTVQGFLFVPNVSSNDNTGCSEADLSHIPSNVTRLTSFPPQDFYFIGFAPWTNPQCVQYFLSQMRAEAVKGAIFYHPDGQSAEPPPDSDPSWSLNDGGKWKDQNQFPIYALPGTVGASIMTALGQYSGNMTSAPHGDQLVQLYNPHDTVRLFTRMNLSAGAGIPSLWVFLIIVLAILLAIVLTTSVLMHLIQRRQRTRLSRRVANGEVDLEALGIKRLNVPQEQLDKMPRYTYTSRAEGVEPIKNARQVPFTQPTCPICLDDFVHGETNVRELPCNHIFHPECIDPFLRDNSSLCPMCKTSALPAGCCPVQVTNLMVRRERLIRRMRQQAAIDARRRSQARPHTMISAMQRRVRTMSLPSAAVRSSTRAAILSAPSEGTHGTELYSIDAASRRQARESQLEADVENLNTVAEQPQPEEAPPPVAHGAAPTAPTGSEVPAEIQAQGTSARRAWLRQRLARQQEQEYTEAAEEAEAVDTRRPLWRRIAGRVNQRWE